MTRQVTPFHFIGTGEVARMEEREEKILEDGMMKCLEILSCNACIKEVLNRRPPNNDKDNNAFHFSGSEKKNQCQWIILKKATLIF